VKSLPKPRESSETWLLEAFDLIQHEDLHQP
jgi:hypothetical protein